MGEQRYRHAPPRPAGSGSGKDMEGCSHLKGCTCSHCVSRNQITEGEDLNCGDDDDDDKEGTKQPPGDKIRGHKTCDHVISKSSFKGFSADVAGFSTGHACNLEVEQMPIGRDEIDGDIVEDSDNTYDISDAIGIPSNNLPPNDGRRGLTDINVRIQTFRFWPKPHVASGKDLARCGFYYLGDKDRVKCVYCNLILKDWELGDNPATEHKRFSQYCQFEQYMPQELAPIETSLGISYERPRFPEYAVEYNRTKTFTAWPQNKSQTKEDMAKAGFFSVGQPDKVMCFYCGLKLHNWLEGDSPWFEHARHGEKCTYVRQCKGDDFVKQVKAAVERGFRHLVPMNQLPPALLPAAPIEQPTIQKPAKRQKLNIEQYMNTPSVRSLVEMMMVSKELVIKALSRCLEKSDKCPDASTLMDMVYEIEDEEELVKKEEADDGHEITEEQQNPGSTETTQEAACGTTADEVMQKHTFQVTFPNKLSEIRTPPEAPSGGLLSSQPTSTILFNGGMESAQASPKLISNLKDLDKVTENHRPKSVLKKEDSEDETLGDEDEDIYGAEIKEDPMTAIKRQKEQEELDHLKSENEELQQERRCKICLDEMATILFLPCGHLVCCTTCSPAVRLCPICRKLIQGTVRTFRV